MLEVHVELALLIVKTKRCTMHTDDITNTVNNWEVLKTASVKDNGGVVTLCAVQAGVNDLEGANEASFVHFVGESGINDHTIDVGLRATLGKGNLGELGVAVALSS